MNFLLRPSQTSGTESAAPPSVPSDYEKNAKYIPNRGTTLEGLIAEDQFFQNSTDEDHRGASDGIGDENRNFMGLSSKTGAPMAEKHIDVGEDEGWIAIPDKELPDDWSVAEDIRSFRSLDRFFVFPGEQIHILACLSAYKQDIKLTTPFKLAEVMSKNTIGKNMDTQNGDFRYENNNVSESVEVSPDNHDAKLNGQNLLKEKVDSQKAISAGESLLRMEDHRRQTQMLLQRFENSHFFVRISESDVSLWSNRSVQDASIEFSGKNAENKAPLNAAIERGNFDASASGGLARNAVKCCSLSNGDIVVLLQVNVGVDFVKDPVLEIFQFEKYQDANFTSESQDNLVCANHDPCGELLKWLLPLDNAMPPPAQPLIPPPKLSSNSSIRSTSVKSNFSASSGSQLFSFPHFRSYSMSSLPPTTVPPLATTPSSKPNIDLGDSVQFSSQKFVECQKLVSEKLLSFRGISLEPDRFSVRCGLEGIYVPGRKWRRKIEIIQPIAINSFSVDCNMDDLICVQIKNISPAHAPDIVVCLDGITVIFEELSEGGPPISLPIASIESGNGHSLPNLALRRGEEHSFILKPATSMLKTTKDHREESSLSSNLQAGSSLHVPVNLLEGKMNGSIVDQYAVLVSCRCSCSESKLFFKHPTSWRPRMSRDLMISIASEMSRESPIYNGRAPKLPTQVLTLQASNLTSEDQTLTVLAPASLTSSPSVMSFSSSPSMPMSPFASHSKSARRLSAKRQSSVMQRLSSVSLALENQINDGDGGPQSASLNEQTIAISDVLPSSDMGHTHLWLQSRVPLGCVPSQSTGMIKLQLLPLTDGIITLDSLQIEVKEKGLTYVPEHSLKIHATSGSIAI